MLILLMGAPNLCDPLKTNAITRFSNYSIKAGTADFDSKHEKGAIGETLFGQLLVHPDH